MSLIKSILKFIVFSVYTKFAKKKTICFESLPELDGSSWMIYSELKKRGFAKKYRLIWLVDANFQVPQGIEYCRFFGRRNFFQRLRRFCIWRNALVIVDSNRFVQKKHPSTFRLYAQHGAALKKALAYTRELGDVDAILSLSENIANVEKSLFSIPKEKFEPLGYPANDRLFGHVDLNKIRFWDDVTGNSIKYKKIIGWLPTYRQHRVAEGLDSGFVFPFGVPLLKTEDDFSRLNELLKSENILLAIQIHHAQAKNFPIKNFSNIVLISSAIKEKRNVSTAVLMQNFDAMVTDYSAAYYEYILLNRPIALSIDDYADYSKNPGFSIDYFEWIKGVYLKDVSDLMMFVKEVSSGVDSAKAVRENALCRIHKYVDNLATKRVVDFLVKKADLSLK